MTIAHDLLRDARDTLDDVWTAIVDALLMVGVLLEVAREIAVRTVERVLR